MKNNKKIDFFLIGTQKAGTTSLYQYLVQHPEIYFSEVKELRYFIDEGIYSRGENYLNNFFYNYAGQKLVGTSHVHMLCSPEAPKRTADYNRNAKLIVILRSPLDRAVSAYLYAKKNGWEKQAATLSQAFEMEKKRITSNPVNFDLLYFHNGLYFKHLENWRKFFSKENFIIVTDAQLKLFPQETVNRIFPFLNISEFYIDTSKKYNTRSDVRSADLQQLLLSRTGYKKVLGKILPDSLKVKIRSKIIPKLLALNTVNISDKNVQEFIITEEEKLYFRSFFENDIIHLETEYGIRF
jgi:hypothetical protein